MDETPRAKRSKTSREKEPVSNAREIQNVSPELVMERETATQRFTPEYQEIGDEIQRDFIFTRNDHESQVDNSKGGRYGASTSSGHQSELSQENIKRISDGLYKFYEPSEVRDANLDVFFFHALQCELEDAHVQDAHISSWRSSSELEEIWPQKWLSQDFPHTRIMSVSYDCYMRQTDKEGRMDMYQITENLLQEIIGARKERDSGRPMIFVGHGFGGIVMKQLCVYAHNKKENVVSGRDVSMFVESIRGFFFYSTPHRGVEGFKAPGEKEGPLVHWMYALNENLVRLHEDFCKLEYRYGWIIFGVAGQDCNLGRPGLRLREGSSRYGDNYMTVTSSHFHVCRPFDTTSNKYQRLRTLIQDVLTRVRSERKPYLPVPKVIVGFDGLITEVLEEHLRTHKFVGICGMGGIGKTTLAKLIFNRVCVRFEFTCFIEEVKGLSGPKSDIKKKVWEQMRHRAVPIRKADQVYEDVSYQVEGKSLLLIFDDVDSDQQVELLQEIAYENGCVGSRFILTSRKSELLRGEDIHIIHPDTLGKEDAEKLLTAYAFSKEQELSESLTKIIQEVIEACEGLPLTLEILGKHLRSRRTELWAEIPSALRSCTKDIANLEERLWARLRLSYEGLPGNEVQNMFLDIASFFIIVQDNWPGPFDADGAVMAWSSIYGNVQNRLQILEDRSLVTVGRYKDPWNNGVTRTEFYMHEHLRRMGQRIAREKGRILDLSWIRSSAEPDDDNTDDEDDDGSEDRDVHQYDEEVVFQGGKDELGKIVAHRIKISRKSMAVLAQSCSLCIMHQLWPKLESIQFMDLYVQAMDCCEQCKSRRVLLPSTLVLFRLELSWDCLLNVEVGGNSAGDLSGTLSLSTCTSLVKLELAGCYNLGELSTFRYLRVLRISSCNGATNWLTYLGELRRLEALHLEEIDEPFDLPISFGRLTALQLLEISDCKVRFIPVSFTNLTNLRCLEIDEIVGRQAISVGSFPQLRRFCMRCWGIADLPALFQVSTALELVDLTLEEAVPNVFRHLVDSWGKMTSLEYLKLTSEDEKLRVSLDLRSDRRSLKISLKGQLGSPVIFEPPPMFLTRVENFDLVCEDRSVVALASHMINLKHLAITVSGEQPVQDIFGRLRNLRKFKLVCTGVENSLVQSLESMTSLEDLTMQVEGPQAVQDVFGQLHNLRKFRLVCSGIENSLMHSLENMTSLEDLTMEVKGPQAVHDVFGQLHNLRRFRLVCSGIENSLMHSLENMTSLEDLTMEVEGPQAVQDVFGHLQKLQKLRKFRLVCSCVENGLAESLKNMINLEDLDVVIRGQQTVRDIFGHLKKLRKIRLVCSGMENNLVESWGKMTSLEYLFLRLEGPTSELKGTLDLRFDRRSLGICLNEVEGPQALWDIFGHLEKLRKFRLVCSCVENSLAESMINLEDLDVEIRGQQTAPDIFGHLQKLRKFRLVCSGMENNLVESWGKLSSLEYLLLRSKDHTSEVEVCLDLQFDRRDLGIFLKGQLGPPGIFEPFPAFLTRVESFLLECEYGSTTAVARNMTNLKHFVVKVHRGQPVPDVLRRLRNLRKFELACRAVESSLVESLGNMINLEDLSIMVHGEQTVGGTFGHLQKLRKFKLVCSGVANSLVKSLENLINLEYLTIEVQGEQTVRDIFGHLQNLREFRLVCSSVENNLMGSLGELTSLEVLDVNSKHGNMDIEIRYRQPSSLRSLKIWLKIDENHQAESGLLKPLKIRLKGQQAESIILEPLPVFWRKFSGLDLKCEHGAQTAIVRNMIHLESCLLVVEGPRAVQDVFGDLQKLRIFFLKCHAVKDNLEGSFRALSSLELLDLRCETMEHFPHVFGCFSTLEDLRISCPSLRALPDTVGNFIGLRTFKMVATGLQFLPDSIGQLSQLEKLSLLCCNHLTSLPETLGQLPRLVSLKIPLNTCHSFNVLIFHGVTTSTYR
ncbi:hypothetical protein R1sor_016741 [Riccia sorocarpa]|uniref:NB-ARC domain-containing protein n=1 Tax=Riccia sorocarpa TaxID=122646 RepID=A0ABD3HJ78_9MARC